MGKLIITTSATLLLLAGGPAFSGTLTPTQYSTPVSLSDSAAGGEENVDALKAELASVKTKLASTETGRQYLLTRLQESLQGKEDDKAAHQAKLDRALKGRSFLSAQYQKSRNKLVQQRNDAADLEGALAKAKKGRTFLSAQYLKSRNELKQVRADNAEQTQAMEKENARLSLALERALRGKAYLRGLLDEHEADAKDGDGQKVALERAIRGREYLKEVVGELKSQVASQNQELDQMATVSFAQINSAIAERDAALAQVAPSNASNSGGDGNTQWADDLSAVLTNSFGASSGTEVSALSNNTVSIKVGNTGLFNPGGTVLSDNGKALLSEIGAELQSKSDTQIKIVGHTDNIPTGSSSRYASNDELSLARATSALSYLSSIGVPTDRLAAAGVGAGYPLASNDTAAGRLANRRVEIVLAPSR